MCISRVSLHELQESANGFLPDMVKAVVDIHSGIICVDGELHSDLEFHVAGKWFEARTPLRH